MFARTETKPNGSVIILSERRIQRRQFVNDQAGTVIQPALASFIWPAARISASETLPTRNFWYSGTASTPRHPIADGAVCVCVAETSILSTGMPVARWATSFASSTVSRIIIQVSTTQSAIRDEPSSRTKARACKGSVTLVADLSRKPPLVMIGKPVGVMSTLATPALNTWACKMVGDVQPVTMSSIVKKKENRRIMG